MRKLLFLFIAFQFLLFSKSFAQNDSTSDKKLLDSLIQNDDFLKMINDMDASESYFKVEIGIGNQLYSSENKAVKNLQNTSPFVFTPSIGYYHKSGLGLSLTGYLLNENSKTAFYQFALSPSYYYNKGEVVKASLSYTHYFENNQKYTSTTSPIQDEFDGSILFKKHWLKPEIAFGYSSGTTHEIVKIDTLLKNMNPPLQIKYTDSITTAISSFSIVPGIEHSFDYVNLFSKDDALEFTIELSLVTGINNYRIEHQSTTSDFNNFTKKRLKKIRHFQSQSQNNKLAFQSTGVDMNVVYSIGKFYFEPDLYLDYYLPKTTDKRFSQFYNFIFGITF